MEEKEISRERKELHRAKEKRQKIKRRGGVVSTGKARGRLSNLVKISKNILDIDNARKLFIPYLVIKVPQAMKVIDESLESNDPKTKLKAAIFVIKSLISLVGNTKFKDDDERTKEIVLEFKEDDEEKTNS